MVLEALVSPFKADKKPFEVFVSGFVFATIAIFLAIWVFRDQASIVSVFLTVMACFPLVYLTIKKEEKKDVNSKGEESILLKEHSKALKVFILLFLGISVAYTFWYVVLPTDYTNLICSVQIETISRINNNLVQGNAISPSTSVFLTIFLNNIKVLVFCLLFAFIYGLGAIFILVWNASVIGAAVGNFIRLNLAQISASLGAVSVGAYLKVVSFGFLRYAIHGIPEILAYFTAGLAGGIISIAVIRHDLNSKNFEKIILDSSDLILISVLLLIIAGLLEVYVTPLLF